MYIGVHRPKTQPGGDNKGSSVNLVNYLTKEDNIRENEEPGEIEKYEKEGFFNHDKENILSGEAIKLIDDNSKGLEKKDSKYFMLTINPSQKELRHIVNGVLETHRNIKDISELTETEYKAYKEKLKDYTKEVMDIYAKQFDREVNGRKITGKDLVYVAKLEEQRHYTFEEKISKENRKNLREIKKLMNENKRGNHKKIEDLKEKLHRDSKGEVIKAGDKKERLQTHIHIVVSRYDKEKQTKMSPLANSRGYSKEHQVGGRNVKVGFSRLEFSLNCEQKFDQKFNYQREDFEQKAYHVQKARQAKGNITSVMDKYGHIDPINSMKFAYKTGQNTISGKGINLKAFSPENLSKMFVDKIDPIQNFKNKMNVINQAKQQVKSVIKSGGLEI